MEEDFTPTMRLDQIPKGVSVDRGKKWYEDPQDPPKLRGQGEKEPAKEMEEWVTSRRKRKRESGILEAKLSTYIKRTELLTVSNAAGD